MKKKRTKVLVFRLTENEEGILSDLMNKEGTRNVSEFIRSNIFARMDRVTRII